MIFSEHFIRMHSLYYDNYEGQNGVIIAVYSGIQPTMEEYITNYNSSYNFSSSNLLQIILTGGIITTVNERRIVVDPNADGYTQGLYSVNAGTGTWATIRPIGSKPVYNLEGYYELDESAIVSVQNIFINTPTQRNIVTIVPISDLTDTGVIKFNSTTFSHPDIDQEDRALDLRITVSV